MPPAPTFSPQQIRTLRRTLGLTQQQFASRLGLSHKSVISCWESGTRSPGAPSRALLSLLWAEVFGDSQK